MSDHDDDRIRDNRHREEEQQKIDEMEKELQSDVDYGLFRLDVAQNKEEYRQIAAIIVREGARLSKEQLQYFLDTYLKPFKFEVAARGRPPNLRRHWKIYNHCFVVPKREGRPPLRHRDCVAWVAEQLQLDPTDISVDDLDKIKKMIRSAKNYGNKYEWGDDNFCDLSP